MMTWIREGWEALMLRVAAWVSSRVVFVTSDALNLRGSEQSRWSLVEIIGREHYRERHRTVPIARWWDAKAIAELEARAVTGSLFNVGPLIDGHRKLTFFEPTSERANFDSQAIFRFPETVVLSQVFGSDRLARVIRPTITFFLSPDGSSHKAGGLLAEPERVAHAMGLKPGWQLLPIEQEGPWLLAGLRSLPLSAWLTAWSPAAIRWIREVRAPVLGSLFLAVMLNLVLASAYLTATTFWRTRSLEALGPEVGSLLNAQREVDSLAAEQRVYGEVLNSRQPVYPVWGAVSEVWKAGGWLSAVRLSEGVLTLRGRAPSATEVLSALSNNSAVSNPSFAAAVRQEGGMQEFVIELRLVAGVEKP